MHCLNETGIMVLYGLIGGSKPTSCHLEIRLGVHRNKVMILCEEEKKSGTFESGTFLSKKCHNFISYKKTQNLRKITKLKNEKTKICLND